MELEHALKQRVWKTLNRHRRWDRAFSKVLSEFQCEYMLCHGDKTCRILAYRLTGKSIDVKTKHDETGKCLAWRMGDRRKGLIHVARMGLG